MPALSERRKSGEQRRWRPAPRPLIEGVAVMVVIAVAIAFVIWFLFFSRGGLGPGTV